MIKEFYKDKTILLTGTTGFLAKIVLEKLLRSNGDIKKIYCLIRPKKGSTVQERLIKEVLSSQAFDRLRESSPNFDEWAKYKVHPIEGDLLKPELALSEEDKFLLRSELDIIINSAASVSFNDRLDKAININVYGSVEVMEFGKSCSGLMILTQISTAYVNSDKLGDIKEMIYPPKNSEQSNPSEHIANLMKIKGPDLEIITPKLLGTFPNTYTYTKGFAERIIQRGRGDLSVAIVRPTIIGCSYSEPFPGWIDSLVAISALLFTKSLGMLKHLQAKPKAIIDIIAADICCNLIITATAYQANRNTLQVFHCASSTRNPITVGEIMEYFSKYYQIQLSKQRISNPNLTYYSNRTSYQIMFFLERVLPCKIINLLANTIGTKGLKKKAKLFKKLVLKMTKLNDLFTHFVGNVWYFEAGNTDILNEYYTKEDLEEYPIDMKVVDWKLYYPIFGYGLMKFILKEEAIDPIWGLNNILLHDRRAYFSYVQWIRERHNKGTFAVLRPDTEMKQIIFGTNSVIEAINEKILQLKAKYRITGSLETEEQINTKARKLANEYFDRMHAQMDPKYLVVGGYIFKKFFEHAFERIIIDPKQIEKLKKIQESGTPFILCPTHRSYMDTFILHIILLYFKMKTPFVASTEDFLNVPLIHIFFRKAGAFFIKRSIKVDEIYKNILNEYTSQLLVDGHDLEIFIEGTRSRNGKSLNPKFGMLRSICSSYFDRKVEDLQFVPIGITYEKVLEVETFPVELLGEKKTQESLIRIIKSLRIMFMNLGTILVEIGNPISLYEFEKQYPREVTEEGQMNIPINERELVQKLGRELIVKMNENLSITSTSLIAAILLDERRGMNESQLIQKMKIITKQLKMRGAKMGNTGINFGMNVKNGLRHLDKYIQYKKDILEPSVLIKTDYKSLLLLSYYRNNLAHILSTEAIIATVLLAFGEQIGEQRSEIEMGKLWDHTKFLALLLQDEFVNLRSLQNIESFWEVIHKMNQFSLVKVYNKDTISISEGSQYFLEFLCSLIWPFVDAYWIACLYLFSLLPNKQLSTRQILHKIQWFGETLYEERFISFNESCSLDVIKTAIGIYQQWHIIETNTVKEAEDKKSANIITLTEEYNDHQKLELLLNQIEFYRKKSPIGLNSIKADVRKTLLSDFPFMAKL